jgi:DNA-binding CsgD family transcriptional regulator
LGDLRAAFRLIGECRELGADSRAWRLHLLDGLRHLTGAQMALYLHIHALGTQAEGIAESLDSGFAEPSHLNLWAHYQAERAYRDDPFHQRYFADIGARARTRRLEAVVDAATWRRSRHYNDYIRACGLRDRIASSIRLPGTAPPAIQTIVLHRSEADGDYPDRSVGLVRLVHDELRPMLGQALAMPGPALPEPELSKQLERVLTCLLEGDAEKRVAERLGLSPHTVNRHVQRLYRRFDVHSRGELMFRCRTRLPALLGKDR